MHRCSSTVHGNSMGGDHCTCDWFHQTPTNSFSMFFSMPTNQPYDDDLDHHGYSTAVGSIASSSVDCTLSLGTPSTRQTSNRSMENHQRSSGNLCWDIFQTKKKSSSSSSGSTHKSSRGGSSTSGNSNKNNNNNNNLSGGDPLLLARRCANCDTTSTPLWRNGPRGPKSLCNACGIRYKKEERRAASNTSTAATVMDPQNYLTQYHQHTWAHQGNEFRFIEDNDHNSDTGIPFLSWRLNVPDRSGLVHDYS